MIKIFMKFYKKEEEFSLKNIWKIKKIQNKFLNF